MSLTTAINTMKLIVSAFAALLCAFTASTAYAACDDPAGPGVDWRGCQRIDTNLTDAIWTDGRICAEDSIGECK